MLTIRLKEKYRRGKSTLAPHGEFIVDTTKPRKSAGAYRGRTGPRCCNSGCGRKRKLR